MDDRQNESDAVGGSRRFFPYETPRPAQVNGMDTLDNAVSENGFLLLEGACGTGKTMLALAPMIEKLRDPDSKYERVFVITSVKQQRRAFEDAVADINGDLPVGEEGVSAVMLSGMADLTPIAIQGEVGPAENVYDRLETLRENTQDLIDSNSGPQTTKYEAARELWDHAQNHADEDGEYPYPAVITAPDGTEYSPYEARHSVAFLASMQDPTPANAPPLIPPELLGPGVVNPEQLRDVAAKRHGTSPHRVMKELLSEVEVVIGNYNHAFDPITYTQMIDEEVGNDRTLVVVDEAHNLVPRVRDLISTNVSYGGLERALQTLEPIHEWITRRSTGPAGPRAGGAKLIRDEFLEAGVTAGRIEEIEEILSAFHWAAGKMIETKLSDKTSDIENATFSEEEVSFRDPKSTETDEITELVRVKLDRPLSTVEGMGSDLGDVKDAYESVWKSGLIDTESYHAPSQLAFRSTGRLVDTWLRDGSVTVFRQAEVDTPSYRDRSEFEWNESHSATLKARNCIPRKEIANRLDTFGGGILMSATLKPFEVFRETAGIDILDNRGRRIDEEQYSVPFPERNRRSHSVKMGEPFTYKHRGGNPNLEGDIIKSLDNNLRRKYANIITTLVKTTPGNVLLAMPSYTEAQWAGEIVKRLTTLPAAQVHIDERSSASETEEMKRKFFASKDDGFQRVLATSTRGTLIEGVDYDGDKLLSVAVCGVPLPRRTPYNKAIEAAYEEQFGNGYEYAFTIPAVYAARQAVGRVIRSEEDLGVRLLVDDRYTEYREGSWKSVRERIPHSEQREFGDVSPEDLEEILAQFWDNEGRQRL